MKQNSKINYVRWSIKWKIMAMFTIIMAGLVIILTYEQVAAEKKILKDELGKRTELIRDNLLERGKSFVKSLVWQIENNIAAYNISEALEVVRDRTRREKEIKYSVLTDSSGFVFINTSDHGPNMKKYSTRESIEASLQHDVKYREIKNGGLPAIEFVCPVKITKKPWGILRVVYTLTYLNTEIKKSKEIIRRESAQMITRSVFTAAGFMLICCIIVYFLSARISMPIIDLTNLARRISGGDFTISKRLNFGSSDEIGVLARELTEMRDELKESYEKLKNYNKTLERKVFERTEELNQRNIELDRANKTKSDFIANMSHEFKTPLNAILGMTGIMLEMGLTKRAERYLNTVESAAGSLLDLINGVLDFSKIEADKLILEDDEFDLHQLVRKVVDMFFMEAGGKKIELMYSIEKDVPEKVCGDPLRLRQILVNLTSNAVKFTNEGEIHLNVEVVSKNKKKAMIRFSVRDTGIGTEPGQIPSLFESFTQVDGSTTRKFGGTGLGLTISRGLVEKMGGEIWAKSSPGKGSTFFFTAELRIRHKPCKQKPRINEDMGVTDLFPLEGKSLSGKDDQDNDLGEVKNAVKKDLKKAGEILDELGNYLNNNNIQAKAYLFSARKYLAQAGFAREADLLAEQIKRFDFKEARQTLSEIMGMQGE